MCLTVKLQAAFRGYQVRRDLMHLEEDLAAVRIQATWRGFSARMALLAHLEALESDLSGSED